MNIGVRELILQRFRVHERKGIQWVGDHQGILLMGN